MGGVSAIFGVNYLPGLPNWKAALMGSPSTAKIALVGDSTSLEANDYPLYERLRTLHTTRGYGLYGMTADSSHIIDGGNNGQTCTGWLNDVGGTYTFANLVSDAPDLVIFSFGINDLREAARTEAQLTADITACVARIRASLPTTDIVLRTPNSFLTTDSGAGSPYNYVDPQTPQNCQLVSDALWRAYDAQRGLYTGVVVADLMTAVFGRTAPATSVAMANQIHPSQQGYGDVATVLVDNWIGKFALQTEITRTGTGAFTGFSADFYGGTDPASAMSALIANGFQGLPVSAYRIQAPTSDEYGHAWFETRIAEICDELGDDGYLICVVGDQTYLQTWADSGQTIYDTMDSIMTAYAAASGKPTVIVQIGNEPYIGASGTHAELDATLASRAIAASVQVKTDHPTVKTCMPPLGTFFTADPAGDLDTNWTEYISLFTGHSTFDYLAANCYPVNDLGDVMYAAAALRNAAADLGVLPIITEVGIENGTSAEILAVLEACGADIPAVVWRVGPGDDYDLIASGAVEVPAVI